MQDEEIVDGNDIAGGLVVLAVDDEHPALEELALEDPGPLGELVSRELTAYADFGHRLAADGLATRLARHILTLTVCPPAQAGDVPS